MYNTSKDRAIRVATVPSSMASAESAVRFLSTRAQLCLIFEDSELERAIMCDSTDIGAVVNKSRHLGSFEIANIALMVLYRACS